ncbi:Organic cation/carnitine transporter 4, partial [Cucurbita argyrosperma subsp. argyrosperma]
MLGMSTLTSAQVELQEQQPPPSTEPAVELPKERLTVDDMLQKYCGEFGPWQLKNFVLVNLSWTLEALHIMVVIFADHEPRWQCVEGVACDRAGKSVCELKPGSWEWVEGRRSSTVAQWGLICGDKYKVGLAQAMFFLGSMMGSAIFGYLSNSALGRKRTLALVSSLNATFGLLTAASPYYWTYVLLRFLTGISSGGNSVSTFVLATEPIGPTKRGVAGMSSFYFFSGGIAILSGMAYTFRPWRELYIASSIPSLVFLVAVLPFVSESPRWYLVRGKLDEAMKVMKSIAKCNGKHLPEGVILLLDQEAFNKDDRGPGHKHEEKGSFVVLIRSPITRIRLLLAMSISFVGAIAYYGLSLNVVNLKTNLYLSVLLNAVAETPAYTITAALLGRLGRKGIGVGTFWLSGGFCLIGSLLRSHGKWKVARMVCGIMGIFGMAGNYNFLFLYLEELFPTAVRNTAMGCATLAIQMGAVLAPFVVLLGGGLAFGVFAVCGLVGGSLVFFLPETVNKPLYDTMAGMELGQRTSPGGA